MKIFFTRTTVFISTILVLLISTNKNYAQTLPHPDHIVVCIMENHPYNSLVANNSIFGNPAAPYINALTTDSGSANFTNMHAIEHPSQPNYLDMFSGSNQGMTTDNLPTNYPFTTPNLARQLIDSSLTYIAYSEDLPSVGFDGDYNSYARKHNPVTNWVGTGTNQVDSTLNQPLTAFPSPTGYDSLPTVAYVVPNKDNDMHNGTDPARITLADTWLQTHLDSYIQWAKTHNSLFILTWDEDDGTSAALLSNQIPTIFVGEMVKTGQYSENINHFNVLRTIEDMYNLGHAGQAAGKSPITDCWKSTISGINNVVESDKVGKVYPNPAVSGTWNIEVGNEYLGGIAQVYDADGRVVWESAIKNLKSEIAPNISRGIYLLRISSSTNSIVQKLVRL